MIDALLFVVLICGPITLILLTRGPPRVNPKMLLEPGDVTDVPEMASTIICPTPGYL